MPECQRMKQIEFKGNRGVIRGALHEGEGTRLAVIVGGQLAANRIGPNRLYFQIALRLSELGWNVIRLDLSGLGESDASLEDVLYEDHVSELVLVCESCVASGLGRPRLISHCAGCFTALDCTNERPDLISGNLLLAPFIRTPTSLVNLMPQPNWREIDEQGWTRRKGVFFHSSFANASQAMSFPATTRNISSESLHLVIARDDELTPWETTERWATECTVKFDIVDGADHNFSAVGPRRELLQRIPAALTDKDLP